MLFCLMTRLEPDYQKLGKFIMKYGISQKLKAEPAQNKTE